jgi:hypothetical protein
MAVLTAAVILVGVLCLADLLLTFGVIRRLHEHTALLSSHSNDTEVMRLGVGATPDSFATVTTGGQKVNGPAGFRLAAFFSTSCSVCPRRVPAFVDYVKTNQLAPDAVLAVVLADAGDSVSYLDRLTEVAQACVQSADGELATAFKVVGYPAFCLLDGDGTVQAVSFDPGMLPGLVPA